VAVIVRNLGPLLRDPVRPIRVSDKLQVDE